MAILVTRASSTLGDNCVIVKLRYTTHNEKTNYNFLVLFILLLIKSWGAELHLSMIEPFTSVAKFKVILRVA